MKLVCAKDYNDMSRKVANVLSAHVILEPSCVLGLATGSTVIGTYKQLVEWYNKGDIDFSLVKTVNLDEYINLGGEDDQSYRYFMNSNFFNYINIDKKNTNVPNGKADDMKAECECYEKLIKSLGGIDVQLLGLGHDGHIGFNEPGKAFDTITHLVDLKEETIKANSRFFKSEADVPRRAVTMGIKTIMQSKQIILAVSGDSKAEILERVINGSVTPEVPGSILQLHPNVIIVADEAARKML